MSAARVTVTLTQAQAAAIITALAYCTSGSPEDIGQEDNASGYRLMRKMGEAFDAIYAAGYRR